MNKITFEDLPSTNTPINATNLNAIQTNAETAINTKLDKAGGEISGNLNVTGTLKQDNVNVATQISGTWTPALRCYFRCINRCYIYITNWKFCKNGQNGFYFF